MKQCLWWAVASLIGLMVVFLAANFHVGSGSTTAVVDAARSRCVKDGFPAEKMLAGEVVVDDSMFGFGGRATVELYADGRFGRDGRRRMEPLALRVELRRSMNLSQWQAISVQHEP
jgi:hypothetical protein